MLDCLVRYQLKSKIVSNLKSYNEIVERLQNYKGRTYPSHTFIRFEVRWGDQDVMNHVHNVKYFEFVEQARMNWFYYSRYLNVTAIEAEFSGGEKTMPILARYEFIYKRPVQYPDTLLIGFLSEAIDLSRGSFKHHYLIYSTAQEQVVSTSEADLEAYDLKEKKRKPVPKQWVF